ASNPIHPDYAFQEDHGIGASDVWSDHAGAGGLQAGECEISPHDGRPAERSCRRARYAVVVVISIVDDARNWLQAASSVGVLTGAGISAESGIPTFRGSDGVWKQYKPEDLATPRAFAKDPRLVWEWYDWRRGLIAKAEPNAGHAALVQLERVKPNVTLITQNVDGLHERAGSRRSLKLHGDIW